MQNFISIFCKIINKKLIDLIKFNESIGPIREKLYEPVNNYEWEESVKTFIMRLKLRLDELQELTRSVLGEMDETNSDLQQEKEIINESPHSKEL